MQKTLKRYFPIFVLPTLIAFSFAFIIPFVMGVYPFANLKRLQMHNL